MVLCGGMALLGGPAAPLHCLGIVLVHGHYLHSAGQGFPLPGGDHGLVKSQGLGLAFV